MHLHRVESRIVSAGFLCCTALSLCGVVLMSLSILKACGLRLGKFHHFYGFILIVVFILKSNFHA